MKKLHILLSAVLLLIAYNASAQTDDAKEDPIKNYITIFGGASTPTGNFKSTDYNNNKSGFARTGVTFGIDAAAYFYKHLGVGVTVSYQDQGELSTNDVTNLANGYTTSFGADGATVSAYKRIHSANIMAGPQYSFTVASNLSIDVRPQAGIIHSFSTPEITTTLLGSGTQTATFYQRSIKGNAFGYGGHIGINYFLSDHVGFTLSGAYISSQGFNVTNDDRTVTTTGRYVTKLPITEFQGTLGLNIRF